MRVVLLVIVLAGCIEPDVKHCGANSCPPTAICIEEAARCVTPEELSACSDKVDGADCQVAAVVGKCIDGACASVSCGNGIVEVGEVCDDGNRLSGDGCSYDCLSRETCGNGVVDFVKGEQCDDGNTDGNDDCESNCKLPRCGDGIVNTATGEVCDDGGNLDGDGCSRDCRSNEMCGNGVRDPGEECDDGNVVDHDGCQHNCKQQRCGDGVPDAGEECDDGNFDENDACLNTCKNATCGDGFVLAGREDCDDGNREDHDDCTNACKLARCGDGIVHTGIEQCDDANGDDTDCCLSSCQLPICGDGIRSCMERCDDGGLEQTCRNGCTTVCTGLGVDFNVLTILQQQTSASVGYTTIEFGGMYGMDSYGGVTYGAYVVDNSTGDKIQLQPDNLADTSVTDLGGTHSAFFGEYSILADSGQYCSANGTGTWTPGVTVTVTDACGITYQQSYTGNTVSRSDWRICPP